MEETIQILDNLIKKYRMFSSNIHIADFVEKIEELKDNIDQKELSLK
ncbi:hypothetical protein HY745_07655 [Candidatus Desantisbacteria bacterium]|nr:hypothetical protein [Candidatus Desantisbacteria bacterium]